VLILGERDHAVADVAGGKHFEVFAETAGGAAVIGDGDYGGEIADEAGDVVTVGLGGGGSGNVTLEAAEEGGEASASTDGDCTETGLGEGWHLVQCKLCGAAEIEEMRVLRLRLG
jgi:hypothetical protein